MSDSPVTELEALVADVAEQLDDKPTLGGLLEVLGWAAPSYVALPPACKVTLGNGKRYKNAADPIAGDLRDATFSRAADLMARIAPEDDEGDPKALTRELDQALAALLKASDVELADVRGSEIAGVALTPTKKTARPKLGSVLAIPAAGGGYHLASVVARNRLGTALGVVDGVVAVPSSEAAAGLPVRPYPYYTGDRLVADGVWRVVGHDEALQKRFPQDPEIYHRPPSRIPGIDLGEFGAAETADGTLRLIDEAEARAVGLGSGYQQSYMGETLQRMLDAT